MDADRTLSYVTRLDVAFNRLSRNLTAAAASHLEEVPGPMLSSSQRTVLRQLMDNGPCQVSEVANHLRVTLSAATGLVDRLVKSKLATRERDQRDRRVVWVKATPEGEAALGGSETRRRMALADLVQGLSADELATMCESLEQMVDRSSHLLQT